jgi:hypothetical protein
MPPSIPEALPVSRDDLPAAGVTDANVAPLHDRQRVVNGPSIAMLLSVGGISPACRAPVLDISLAATGEKLVSVIIENRLGAKQE